MRNAFAFFVVGVAVAAWNLPAPGADKAPGTNPTTAPAPSKFYGTISAVDARAKTFTIEGTTYRIVAETDMTKAADGSAATMADVVVGETARGTYTTTTDGQTNVTKVRFGKKAGSAGGGKKSKEAGSAATQPAK